MSQTKDVTENQSKQLPEYALGKSLIYLLSMGRPLNNCSAIIVQHCFSGALTSRHAILPRRVASQGQDHSTE